MSSQASPESADCREPASDSGELADPVVDVDIAIGEALERLAGCGPVDDLAALSEFLPAEQTGLRRFVLIELIKFDLSLAADAGKLRRIEDYLSAFPQWLSRDSIPLDLVLEEIQLRKEAGENPDRGEYESRFPNLGPLVGQLSGNAEQTAAVGVTGPPPLHPVGSQLEDFLIIQRLGEGAFARVYLARQQSMQRLVALKVSRNGCDEPQALAQLDHPNIVRVFDQRTWDDPPLHLLYMQFHPGGTLADLCKSLRGGSIPSSGHTLLDSVDRNLLTTAQAVPDRSAVRDWLATAEWPAVVAWLGMQLARALDLAHGRGVLHRDVKPANVLLSAEGIPKLADFNVSQSGVAGRAGAAAAFGGSIGYMAPEHLRAISASGFEQPEQVGPPADLYSLAVLLWEVWQGRRPFDCNGKADSWSALVRQQLSARLQPLAEPARSDTASERVLERALRITLTAEPELRPRNGAEMAARLRLALHPEAARLFDPSPTTFRGRLSRTSPWLIAGTVILLPNVAAGVFNYVYNHQEILDARMRGGLDRIALCVNLVAYPLAVPLIIWFTRSMANAVRSAHEGARTAGEEITNTLELGQRAALIGGTLWTLAGVVYPVALWVMFPEFSPAQAMHFFVSLLVCGGVAMIYPFFALALVNTIAYYPLLIRDSLQDDHFDARAEQMVARSEIYLLMAAIIPLLGAALLITSESQSRVFMLTAIAAGIVGLLASFFSYRFIRNRWNEMAAVLSANNVVVPGESEGEGG